MKTASVQKGSTMMCIEAPKCENKQYIRSRGRSVWGAKKQGKQKVHCLTKTKTEPFERINLCWLAQEQ